jgi:outer membrane receptor for ferrienterochelin and colicins
MTKKCFILFLFSFISSTITAQHTEFGHDGILSGVVKTSEGEPAAFIPVFLKDTGFGKETDSDGKFSIPAPAGSYTLVVQSITWHRQEFPVTIVAGETTRVPEIRLIENVSQLSDVVVTGQYKPQSIQNSVFKVRSITAERIAGKGAGTLLEVLNTELGIRFSNDLTTGETDIELMGMSGQNVKVLIDGVPLIDRGSIKQSLSQIDINTIERVEIVEGPMSVIYGTDALAGVVNLITKKAGKSEKTKMSATVRIQEETVGGEYDPFTDKGKHYESIGLSFLHRKGWHASAGLTRNDFGGWKGSYTGRAGEWKPKDQWISNGTLGFRGEKINAWYRLDYLNETIFGYGDVNAANNTATDKNFVTDRFTHQAQSEWELSEKWSMNTSVSWQNYERRTQTTTIDLTTGDRRLTTGEGEQDVSKFRTLFLRNTMLWTISPTVSLQPGVEYRNDQASGQRIEGEPAISDYSVFASSEIRLFGWLDVRPGLRFSKNSTYDAPPVIPSLNTKISLNQDLDLRLSYARGFRAPALRELYFWFFDASHSIKGNQDLEAEHSDSYTGSFTWRMIHDKTLRITSSVSGFYNRFDKLITTAESADEEGVFTYVNIDQFKTTGGTFENVLSTENLKVTIGLSYIGRYNEYSDQSEYEAENLPSFVWSTEINSGVVWRFPKLGTELNFYYKYTGTRPTYELAETDNGELAVYEAKTGDFHWSDLTVTKKIKSMYSVTGGIKNIFDVTRLDNTSLSTGAHSSGGPVPLSYGRSFFIGLAIHLSTK